MADGAATSATLLQRSPPRHDVSNVASLLAAKRDKVELNLIFVTRIHCFFRPQGQDRLGYRLG